MWWTARAEYIASECARLSPDVICFQEVIPSFIKVFEGQPWVGSDGVRQEGGGGGRDNRNEAVARWAAVVSD